MTNFQFSIFKDQHKTIRVDRSGKYVVELVGEGAHAEIIGGFRGKGREQIEIDIEVRHMVPNTTANTHIRGVVDDSSSAKVNGMIKVFKNAQKTNSFLAERILILSDKARAETIPNLEIEADDVKCSHAAAVGKIDAEQIFYLMSRGLKAKDAREMIVEGFLKPVGW